MCSIVFLFLLRRCILFVFGVLGTKRSQHTDVRGGFWCIIVKVFASIFCFEVSIIVFCVLNFVLERMSFFALGFLDSGRISGFAFRFADFGAGIRRITYSSFAMLPTIVAFLVISLFYFRWIQWLLLLIIIVLSKCLFWGGFTCRALSGRLCIFWLVMS